MRKLLTPQQAAQSILYILGALIVFHLTVIVGLVPGSFVWGDQIPQESILPMELIAIVMTVSFGLFILIKMRYLKDNRSAKVVNIGLWIIALIFLINVVTNLISKVSVENFIFAPVALVLALLTVRLALEK